MYIKNLLKKSSYNEDFNKHDFMVLLETHRTLLLQNTHIKDIIPLMAERYKGDFYGLLAHYNVNHNYFYIIMRLNNMNSSDDYDGSVLSIKLPNDDFIDGLYKIYSSNRIF